MYSRCHEIAKSGRCDLRRFTWVPILITLKSVRTRTSDTLFFDGLITRPIYIFIYIQSMPIFVDTVFVDMPVFVDTFLALWKCNKKNISGDSEFFDGNKKFSCLIYFSKSRKIIAFLSLNLGFFGYLLGNFDQFALCHNLTGTISPFPTWEIHCRVMGLLNFAWKSTAIFVCFIFLLSSLCFIHYQW